MLPPPVSSTASCIPETTTKLPPPLSALILPLAEPTLMLPPPVCRLRSPPIAPASMLPPPVSAFTLPPMSSTRIVPPPLVASTRPEIPVVVTLPPSWDPFFNDSPTRPPKPGPVCCVPAAGCTGSDRLRPASAKQRVRCCPHGKDPASAAPEFASQDWHRSQELQVRHHVRGRHPSRKAPDPLLPSGALRDWSRNAARTTALREHAHHLASASGGRLNPSARRSCSYCAPRTAATAECADRSMIPALPGWKRCCT